jgi:hypothetical protein
VKTILLFGAGKSTTVLIDYLIRQAPAEGWMIVIADASLEQITARTGNSPFTRAVKIDITRLSNVPPNPRSGYRDFHDAAFAAPFDR